MDPFEALVPVSATYASLPIAEAFDWGAAQPAIEAALPAGEGYLVAFRSIRSPSADEAMLTAYDERAHIEASGSAGFVHYLKGPLGPDRACLSFCLWTGRAEARAAAGKPMHAEAAALVRDMYERYTLEFLRVTRGADGRLAFTPWDDPLPA